MEKIYEDIIEKLTLVIKRLIVAIIVLSVVIFISNAVWLWAWTSYEYVASETSVITKDGVSNFIGNSGSIQGGE